MAEVLHANSSNFEQLVLQAEGKVLVDFWAPWCGPCRMMAPILDQIAEEDHPGLSIVKVNVDEEPTLAVSYQIQSIPALKIFAGGQVIAEQIGAVPKPALMQMLEI